LGTEMQAFALLFTIEPVGQEEQTRIEELLMEG
jgi:hypothetical protein